MLALRCALTVSKSMYGATSGCCCIDTIFHIGFPSLHFKYKWPHCPCWVKEAKVSIENIGKEHLDDEVETEKLAAR